MNNTIEKVKNFIAGILLLLALFIYGFLLGVIRLAKKVNRSVRY